MSIYSDKLGHVQVVINCLYSIAHLCTSEATLAHNLGALHVFHQFCFVISTGRHMNDACW